MDKFILQYLSFLLKLFLLTILLGIVALIIFLWADYWEIKVNVNIILWGVIGIPTIIILIISIFSLRIAEKIISTIDDIFHLWIIISIFR